MRAHRRLSYLEIQGLSVHMLLSRDNSVHCLTQLGICNNHLLADVGEHVCVKLVIVVICEAATHDQVIVLELGLVEEQGVAKGSRKSLRCERDFDEQEVVAAET